jgi:hypothetical protein
MFMILLHVKNAFFEYFTIDEPFTAGVVFDSFDVCWIASAITNIPVVFGRWGFYVIVAPMFAIFAGHGYTSVSRLCILIYR